MGALMAGVFADKYTRRQSIFAACGEYHVLCPPESVTNVLSQLSSASAQGSNSLHRAPHISSLGDALEG